MSGDDWKQDLSDFFGEEKSKAEKKKELLEQDASRAEDFFLTVAGPAFEEMKSELEKYGRDVFIRLTARKASIIARHEGADEWSYNLKTRGAVVYPETISRREGKLNTTEGTLKSGSADTVDNITKHDIIKHMVRDYKSRR